MKTHQITFKANMINAIQNGDKTQTRRIVRRPLWDFCEASEQVNGRACLSMVGCDLTYPYGNVGDRLWVRESWRIIGWPEGGGFWIQYKNKQKIFLEPDEDACDEEHCEKYAIQCCDDCKKAGLVPDDNGIYHWPDTQEAPTRWRSPRFMPKWAARIWLDVLDVSVERVQEISEADVVAEGIVAITESLKPWQNYRATFSVLWDLINKKRGYGWEMNPWVWVVKFKIREKV